MGFVRTRALWPNGVIPYKLAPGVGDVQWRAAVQAALLDWMAKTEITFVPGTNEDDFVLFVFNPAEDGCSAGGAGKRGGRQDLVCRRNGTEDDAVSVYAHEIGHVVGFIHEHQRPDRHLYVDVNIEAARKEKNKGEPYEIVPAMPGADEAIGQYDCRSVNHYARDRFISPKPGGCAVIGPILGASVGDIAATRHAYRFTPAAGLLHQQSGLSRGPNSLDIFVRWPDNYVHTATWPGEWKGWWRLDNPSPDPTSVIERAGVGVSAPTAISTSPDTIDLFLRGIQDGVFTTSWTGSRWTPWQRVGTARSLSSVAAVKTRNGIQIFVRGVDGGIYAAERNSGIWGNWSRIGSQLASSDVTVVAPNEDTICVFAQSVEGGIYCCKWVRSHGWGSWRRILGGVARFGTSVAAAERAPGLIDLFVIGTNGGVYTAASQDAGSTWRGWWRIEGATAAPGTTVAALSRNPENLDVFIVGTDRRIRTSTWNGHSSTGWDPWTPVLGQRMAPRTGISAVSREPDRIDLFAIGEDGRTLTAGFHAGNWKGWWPVEAQR